MSELTSHKLYAAFLRRFRKKTVKQDLSASEWAAWVLLGDPNARMPQTLEDLSKRIATAITMAKRDAAEQKKYGVWGPHTPTIAREALTRPCKPCKGTGDVSWEEMGGTTTQTCAACKGTGREEAKT